jgi:hypothetical protein
MIANWMLGVLARRGMDRYTVMTWEARLLSRHYQAVLEAGFIGAAIAVAYVVAVVLF